MITALFFNLLFHSIVEAEEAPSLAGDGGAPVILVHLDGRRFSGFLSNPEADPLSLLLLDNTTTRIPKRMVESLRILKGSMSEPRPCVVLLKDRSQRRGMLLEDGFEGVRLHIGPRIERIDSNDVIDVRWRP